MKKRERAVEVADLEAVAHSGEDIVLFFDAEDENIPTSLCVQADFDRGKFGPVQPMFVYLKSNVYQPIQDPDTRISQRQRILDEMNPVVVKNMLHEFTHKQVLNIEKPGYLDSGEWYPGG